MGNCNAAAVQLHQPVRGWQRDRVGAEDRRELLHQGLRVEVLLDHLAADEQPGSTLIHSGMSDDRSQRSAWICAAVGICSALRTGDWLSTCRSGLAFALAKGTSAQALVAELLGRTEGVCHGRSGLRWLVDRTQRMAAWPDARLALLTSLGWAQAHESLAVAVIPEGVEPALVRACLRPAADRHLPLTVISIATDLDRETSAPAAIRCADLESITQAVQQATTRARDHATATHLRLWLPAMPSMATLGQTHVRQGVLDPSDLATLHRQSEHEAQTALSTAHAEPAPRVASAYQYVW